MLPKSVIFEHIRRMQKIIQTLLLCWPLALWAQLSPEAINRYHIHQVESYPIEKQPGVYFVSAPYGQPQLSASALAEIKSKQVLSVDLVYTQYRRSAQFNQSRLNRQRLENLKKILPNLFSESSVDWQLVEQTGAKDYESGKGYFHGFVIKTREIHLSESERKAELEAVKKMLSETKSSSAVSSSLRERNTNPSYVNEAVKYYNVGAEFSADPCELVADAQAHIRYPKEAVVRKVGGKVQAQFTVNKNGDVQDIKFTESIGFGCEEEVKNYLKTMPKWKPARDKQGAVNAYVTLNFWFVLDPLKAPVAEMPCDLIIILPEGKGLDESGASNRSNLVNEVFNRNTSWNNAALVCDVTASMGPYLADLMRWFRANSSKIKQFTFFNDGDMKSDAMKQIGSAGGIYTVPALNGDAVETELYKAMRNGFGGDIPENDVEALLDAQQKAPFADRLIWIADNYAKPRDLILLSQVTKPVSIIVCSNQQTVSVDYLNIARKLKASLHTLTTDLPNLSEMKEGEILHLDDKEYQLLNEKFVRVY